MRVKVTLSFESICGGLHYLILRALESVYIICSLDNRLSPTRKSREYIYKQRHGPHVSNTAVIIMQQWLYSDDRHFLDKL